MRTKNAFVRAVAPILGETYIDLGQNIFHVGKVSIPLEQYEADILNIMMNAAVWNKTVKPFTMMCLSNIVTRSMFDQIYEGLIKKLEQYPVSNYGGNGSYYGGTIYASDLIRTGKEVSQYFYKDLAEVIAQTLYPSDQDLWDIKYQSRNHVPMVCCR